MPRLITRCLFEDYESATENHDDYDRGDLSVDDYAKALHFASYAMPVAADPSSPHRPAVGVFLTGRVEPTLFYVSDYQGGFSLEATDRNEFSVEDIIDLINGVKTVDEIRESKIIADKKLTRGLYAFFGVILLIILYFFISPFV